MSGALGFILCLIFFAPIIIGLPYAAIHLLRRGFKFLLRKQWNRSYVRRAVDCMIPGLIFIFFAQSAFRPTTLTVSRDISQAMHLCDAEVAVLLFYYQSDPNEAIKSLADLESLNFYFEYFFYFIFLPPLLVTFVGYCLEHQREKYEK